MSMDVFPCLNQEISLQYHRVYAMLERLISSNVWHLFNWRTGRRARAPVSYSNQNGVLHHEFDFVISFAVNI